MARPLRKLYRPRVVRNRHRTWMMSMSLATAALGVWAVAIAVARLSPRHAVAWSTAYGVALVFALPGMALAVLTLRAKRSWFLVALVPIVANAMMLALPLAARALRDEAARTSPSHAPTQPGAEPDAQVGAPP